MPPLNTCIQCIGKICRKGVQNWICKKKFASLSDIWDHSEPCQSKEWIQRRFEMPPSQCEGQPYLSVTIFFKETGSLQKIAKSLMKKRLRKKLFSAAINIYGIGPNETFLVYFTSFIVHKNQVYLRTNKNAILWNLPKQLRNVLKLFSRIVGMTLAIQMLKISRMY